MPVIRVEAPAGTPLPPWVPADAWRPEARQYP